MTLAIPGNNALFEAGSTAEIAPAFMLTTLGQGLSDTGRRLEIHGGDAHAVAEFVAIATHR